MTRKQKLILLAFAIADVVVIALLGSIVLRSSPPTPLVSPIQVQVSPCEQRVIDTFSRADSPLAKSAPQVAWNHDRLHIALTVTYPVDAPPDESAQLLWTVLDDVADLFTETCPAPETVILAITARGTATTVQHLAQITGQDVEAWRFGDLSDEALAAQTRYRHITNDAPH